MVNVIEIDAARAGTLYEENEHLRSSEYAQTQDEAILKLRACVQVTVWSKLDISLTNPHAGFALALPEGNDWV